MHDCETRQELMEALGDTRYQELERCAASRENHAEVDAEWPWQDFGGETVGWWIYQTDGWGEIAIMTDSG